MPLALTFDYGQRSAQQEVAHAVRLAHHYDIPHRTISLPLFSDFSNALTQHTGALPHPSMKDLSDSEASLKSAKAVWVPNRNGVFLEVAAGVAEHLGADAVLVGFNREEAATFPDNSIEYMGALENALSFSTSNHVRILSPTATLDKRTIVRLGLDIGVPFACLWSCYEAQEKMCGRCESCQRLKRALCTNEVSVESLFIDSNI